MPEILFPEWRKDNEHSRYPFIDSATLVSDTEQHLNQDAFLDLIWYPIGGEIPFYLYSIERTATAVEIVFSDVHGLTCTGSWTVGVLSGDIVLGLYDEYQRPVGTLIISNSGRIVLEGWPAEKHTFTIEAGEIVATCSVPQPHIGVRGFLLEDGSVLSGETAIVGGKGVWLSDDSGDIRIDFTGDFGQFREKCGEIFGGTIALAIKTINNQPPDESGNFLITPSNDNGNAPIFRIKLQPPSTLIISAISDNKTT